MPHDPTPVLPLTEPDAQSESPDPALPSEADIRRLVDTFYDVVCQDEILGPVFTHHIKDWSAHLPKMYDFWSAVVLHTGRYSGRPIDAHQELPELTPAHFERWLTFWEAAVETVIAPPAREVFTNAAGRMAASMSARLFRRAENS